MSTLNSYLDKRHIYYWPYFFITESEDTEKSYIIHLLINLLKNRYLNYLLIVSTDIAA